MALALKYVENLAQYFRKICDESDNTFMSNTDITIFLEQGWNEFQFFVSDIDPEQFVVSYTTPLAVTTNELDLNNVILGATVTPPNDRLQQIVRVTTVDVSKTPAIGNILQPTYSYESLISGGNFPTKYMLQGRKMWFSSVPGQIIRIEYIPQSLIDWSKQTIGQNEFISDLIQFHDVIALMSAKNYMMIDGADATQILRQLAVRESQLKEFLTRGRIITANRFVGDEEYFC